MHPATFGVRRNLHLGYSHGIVMPPRVEQVCLAKAIWSLSYTYANSLQRTRAKSLSAVITRL